MPILTKRSMLDTTEKFDEIAAGAAAAGSAAAALGREPGTCDPSRQHAACAVFAGATARLPGLLGSIP